MPTPQRLPIVNGDDGQWGTILKQYLQKEHYDDGTDNSDNGSHQKITIRAGTTAAGTAPLKFTSGSLLTSAEAGAMEFLSDSLFFTVTTGAVRRTIATYDDSGGATGDIYYRNSSGVFTRLAIGSSTNVLTVVGGLPAWGSGGSGDVSSDTASSVDSEIALFSGTGGKTIKRATGSGIAKITSGVLSTATADTDYVTPSGTVTLTNKRISKRTDTTTSSATPTINTDNVDFYSITAQAVAITSFTTNLSGTPTEGQTLWIAITDNGTARAITWGTSFEASTVALPTTTVISTRLDVGFVWNSVTSKWRCVAVA